MNGDVTESISNAVTRKWAKGTGGPAGDECQNLITDPLAFRKSRRAQSVSDDETWVEGDHANTLNSFDAGDVRTTHAIVSDSYYVEDCENAALRANGANDGPPRTD